MACDSCHKFPTKNWKEVRKADAAFPDVVEFPQHDSCIECHRTQFFARERPAPRICSNCHVQVTPRNTGRHTFASLGHAARGIDVDSEFRVYFPHDKHEDAVTSDEKENCSVCHRTHQPQGNSDDEYVTQPPKDLGEGFWLKKGTFKTLPATHEVCFTCHSTESELPPLPSDCAACHKLSSPDVKEIDADPTFLAQMTDTLFSRAWRRRDSATTFRHEVHSDMTCVSCHQIAAMNTVATTSLKVPVKSCGGGEGCHVTPTADDGGILNFEMDQRKADAKFQCTKCHLRFGKQALPLSHQQAISDLQKK